MGFLFSKNNNREHDAKSDPPPKYSWEQKGHIDRRQLIISDEDHTVLGRLPGQLNGKQFLISNCKNCTILVLDYTGTVTVDKCTECHIFIAPCKGSVYIRECTNCVFMVAGEQFRARDCKKCDVLLYSTTHPVIESSSRISFGCFQCKYPQLASLFVSAGLSVFNNQWSIVHDFDQGAAESNWSLLSEERVGTGFLLEGEFADVGLSFTADSSVVPVTVGPKQKPPGESCLVAFLTHNDDDDVKDRAMDFLHKIHGKAVLVFTRQMALQDHEAETLFAGNIAYLQKPAKMLQLMWRVSSRSAAARTCLSALCRPRKASTLRNTDLKYNPARVESKWQAHWQSMAAAMEVNNDLSPGEEKFYCLSMFPYPSGRFHMGHVRMYTISDTIARLQRMRGKKVLHPMGWDAFGSLAENAAIERGINVADCTKDNISHMKSQLLSIGCQFDWHREVFTCSSDYYKWTQWLFLQMYKHGLVYRKKVPVNWDPVDETVLANHQVDEAGRSCRSGAQVERRYIERWFLKISDYAESLLQGLEGLNWPSRVKFIQSNWIGKSEGAFFDFQLCDTYSAPLRVFTTRPETVFGVSYLAISPEHELLQNTQLLDHFVLQTVQEFQRPIRGERKEKGSKNVIALGLSARHPFTGAPIPVYAADYVSSTQAVMGVPAHDARDHQLALEHSLPVVEVINGGKLVHSEQFSGMLEEEGSKAIVDHALSQGFGGHMTQYKLRDWLISRQRYWGTPIPVLHCEQCGVVPVADDNLPVILPTDVQFSGRSSSHLAQSEWWCRASCGKPGCCARRETDTMDAFMDSSWSFLRCINPSNSERPFTKDMKNWIPVDIYIGEKERTVPHLLYARFVTHFLNDIGLVSVRDSEPFQKVLTQGEVQGRTYRMRQSGRYLWPEELERLGDVEVSWEKMSTSKYNEVDPKDLVQEFGADTVRVFMLFQARPEWDIKWDTDSIHGISLWLNRLWTLCQQHVQACKPHPLDASLPETHTSEVQPPDSVMVKEKVVSATHKVTRAYEQYSFNAAVRGLMELSKVLQEAHAQKKMCKSEFHQALLVLLKLLAPMAPHISSELWEVLRETSKDLKLQLPEGDVLQHK